MGRLQRLLMNLGEGWFQLHRRFPSSLLDEITAAVAQGERRHRGEVRLAVESRLSPLAVLAGLDAPTRAHQIFRQLQVWDTEHNNGVLVYVLLAEHRIEIVADRGIASRVSAGEWTTVCDHMREAYARNQWREGSLRGIEAVHALLELHFPADSKSRQDELPDRPVLL
ncbi:MULTISPECIES: TPM domain-containing protein [Rhodanobacter]|uniref:TPM domain-containing protein n=1 Tax=Rhodanobacter hydrolyticus TaxID=2250595 RepID=A0ABW8J6L6_9GAMM|nr:TPM domain-containing protein [Rhodanobacter sp. 7MK24]MBD8879103.1 TPM domain-containing protein [Rhodanobacter sp. 7MK24]